MREVLDVSGVGVDDIRDEYHRRGMADLSDVDLAGAVAKVISVPRRDPANSFVLHSALELGARLSLLPMVAPAERELARLHVLAIAAQYEGFGPPIDELPSNAGELSDRIDPVDWLSDALAAGDLDEVDRAASTLAETSPTPQALGSALIDRIADATAAAAHAPIFLFHLGRVSLRGELTPALLRPLARELGRNPDWRIGWVADRNPTAPTVAAELESTLAELPILGVPESTFIRPLMAQADHSVEVTTALDAAVGTFSQEAARAVMRVAARSMLAEPPDHAPYGWSHCLTMPQAVLGMAPLSRNPDRLLAIAATHVAGFRTGEGSGILPRFDPTQLNAIEPTALATDAATSHDAHVVKYVLACLDACSMDPAAASLYLNAGQRLLDVWRDRGGDPTDPLAS